MDVVITGTIVAVLPEISGVSQKGNAWKKAQYRLEHEHGNYPKCVVFDVMGDKINSFAIKEGEEIVCHLNIDSHEYNGRWYNEIQCWKVERSQQNNAPQATQAAPTPQPALQPAPVAQEAPAEDPDKLPF